MNKKIETESQKLLFAQAAHEFENLLAEKKSEK